MARDITTGWTRARPAAAARAERSVYLDAYLAPFRRWLERDTVTEIIVNRPGEVWIEDAAHPGMQRIETPEIDDRLVQRLAEQVARVSHQGINREHPLLGATLPMARACSSAGRRRRASTGRWRSAATAGSTCRSTPMTPARWRPGEVAMPDPQGQPIAFLREAIRARKTILISGGTSTGKTTFLNAMLGEIPRRTRGAGRGYARTEAARRQRRRPVAVKGELGEAKVTANELLQAALRLRPDRIVLGELRGAESVSFLRAINTGHPGSFSTIHANSCAARSSSWR
jgi:type IV secretion system protein VirB11